MTGEEELRGALASLEVNGDCTEAVLLLGDGSRLWFRHRVGERRAGAVPAAGAGDAGLAGRVLSRVAHFRLNRKHLDVQFSDGSRWEARFASGRQDR